MADLGEETSTALTAPTKPSAKANAKPVPGRRTGTKRDRLGCLTCRHRRKKCDEQYPLCGHCKRLNLVCKREPPRRIHSSSDDEDEAVIAGPSTSLVKRKSEPTFQILRAPDTTNLGEFADPIRGRDRRAMLSYYTEILANLLSTTHHNNSFLSVFLPMAMDSPPLQRSLVAWSSAHLSHYHKPHHAAALENRSSALLLVAASLSSPIQAPSDSDAVLAACLVLCATDIVLGDTRYWYQHLCGARNIILSARSVGPGGVALRGPDCFKASRDGQWLLRNFAYHDILGAVTSVDPPLIVGTYWLNDGAPVVDAYFGAGSEILGMVSEICTLDTRNRARVEVEMSLQDVLQGVSGPFVRPDFWHTANNLEIRLTQWVCQKLPDFCIMELAEAYRSSALICLYRKQRQWCQANRSSAPLEASVVSKIARAVHDTIHRINRIPIQSLPECGLVFPLFMAGGDATEVTHIETIRLRLGALLAHRGFKNILRCSEVLEELWRLRAAGAKGPKGSDVDWMDVLQKNDWKLVLS